MTSNVAASGDMVGVGLRLPRVDMDRDSGELDTEGCTHWPGCPSVLAGWMGGRRRREAGRVIRRPGYT